MSSKKDDPQLTRISGKLDTLIRLSALGLVKDIKKQKDQIAILSDAGFKPREIADILRTSRNTVNVTLNAIRKERAVEKVKEETGPENSVEVTATQNKAEEKQNAQQT